MKLGSDTIPPLKDEQIAEAAEILRPLGEPSQLRILLACLAEPASVGEIAARVAISRSLVSHHFRLLRASRLLQVEKSGKQMISLSLDDRVRCIITGLAQHVTDTPEDGA